jgi:hypothetical protein
MLRDQEQERGLHCCRQEGLFQSQKLVPPPAFFPASSAYYWSSKMAVALSVALVVGLKMCSDVSMSHCSPATSCSCKRRGCERRFI